MSALPAEIAERRQDRPLRLGEQAALEADLDDRIEAEVERIERDTDILCEIVCDFLGGYRADKKAALFLQEYLRGSPATLKRLLDDEVERVARARAEARS